MIMKKVLKKTYFAINEDGIVDIEDFLGEQDLDIKESVEKLISEIDKEMEVEKRINLIREAHNKFKNK